MPKSDTLHIRVDPAIKAGVEATLNSLGMSTAEAINIFLHQIILTDGLPFAITIPKPNTQTLNAMQEARDIAAGKIPSKCYHSVAELMEDLNNDVDD